ncbi:SusC/RagA family TonB-linked outer membrane protein [Pedobacter nyackensis]|uniref:SusC/RagA family TonB-linked outer membrane protein n=1 Tax=Pedobacter nyackensis TaxID=475255 RepID=UPI00292D4EB8|nr:SusC/RagA family TonB-linked outer membrane protein [Pedobacter nyackensis]
MKKMYLKYLSMLLLVFSTMAAYAQKTVTGTVRDESGPMPGVSISVKGTQKVTQTDALGKFSISASDSQILVFTAVGYVRQEIVVGNKSVVNATLTQEENMLTDVVVTALGVKREAKSIGYSVQKVVGDDLVKGNAPTLSTGLMGKVSGLNVSQSNGIEGGSQRVVIRGNTSIGGSNQPLYVIDGMPLDNTQVNSKDNDINSTTTYKDWGTVLNFLNPEDIEDVNVLKGPTAAALYGARGGNGVILITTKKGKMKDGLGIDYSYNFRSNDPYRYQDMQNTYGYGGAIGLYSAVKTLPKGADGVDRYPAEAPWTGSGLTGANEKYLSHGPIPGGLNSWGAFSWYGTGASWGAKMEGQMIRWWDGTMRAYSPQPDNLSTYYRTGNTRSHNVSISGANDLGSLRVSYSRQDNKAIVNNSDFSNNTLNFGGNIKVSKKFNAEVTGSYINYNRLNSPTIGNADDSWGKFSTYGMSRDYQNLEQSLYINPDGTKHRLDGTNYPMSYPYGGYGSEMYWKLYQQNTTLNHDQLLGTAKISGDLTDWLSVMGRASVNFGSDEMEKKYKPIDIAGVEGGKYGHELYKTTDRNLEFLLTAHKDNFLGSKFNTSFSVGGSSWSTDSRAIQGWNDGPFNIPFQYFLQNINKPLVNASDIQPKEQRFRQKINSMFGIANVSYNNFLFLELTGRNDWSSTLPSKTNSYFYPAASLSYVFTEHLKLGNMKNWLDYGKLRLAYAGTATGAEPFMTTNVYDSSIFGGLSTRATPEDLLPLDLLRPQRSKSYEGGVDLSFLKNRLGLTFTYYKVKSTSQILKLGIAPSSGVSTVITNVGELENKGYEFTLRGTVVRQDDFSWDLTLNGAHNQNKLINLGDGVDEYNLNDIFGNNGVRMKVKVGENYGTIYGTDYTYKNGQRVVEKIKDVSGNTVGTRYVVTPEQVPIGNAVAKLTGGLGTNFRYKNFSLYALADFKWGGDIWSGSYSTAMGNGLAPATLLERDGGGLPYTYPDGSKANHGVILDGVFADGTKNTDVVNYMWKYAGVYSAWTDINMPRSAAILENSWIKLRELRLTYQVPKQMIQKSKFVQNLSLSLVGRDLFYIYTSLPDRLNPEAINGIGNAQGIEFGALPGVRSFGFSVNVSF